jgi:hypothetical protein
VAARLAVASQENMTGDCGISAERQYAATAHGEEE